MRWTKRVGALCALSIVACGGSGASAPDGGAGGAPEGGTIRPDTGTTFDAPAHAHDDAADGADGGAPPADAIVSLKDAGADASKGCGPTEIMCGSACVDPAGDNDNCGGCAISCDGTCTQARCAQSLADVEYGVGGIAVDGTNVYWTDLGVAGGTGSVNQCPVAGCAMSPTVLASSLLFPTSLAIDSTNVYYLVSGAILGDSFGPASVGQVAIAGPGDAGLAPIVLASNLAYAPVSIGVDVHEVFWNAGRGGPLVECSIGGCGGTPTTFGSASWHADDFVIASGVIYFRGTAGTASGVLTCPTTGCTTPGSPFGSLDGFLFVGGSTLYAWDATVSSDNSETGVIDDCPLAGCTAAPGSYLNVADAIVGAVADASHVYWIDAPKGQALRCPVGGCTGAPDVIYTFPGGAQDPEALIVMALDATSLYLGADDIVRITPK